MTTFGNMQTQGYLLTEKEMISVYKLAADDYLKASKILEGRISDLYAKYLTGIPKEDYYTTVLKRNRLDNALKDIKDQYTKYARLAAKKLGQANELAITNNFYRQRFALSFLDGPVDLKFGIIPPSIVEASVYGSADAWTKIASDKIAKIYGNPDTYMRKGTLTDLLLSNRPKDIAKVRQTLTTSLITGDSYTQTAQKIRGIVGGSTIKDGVRSYQGTRADALRIARTEGNRNLNAGNMASSSLAKSEGMDIVRHWNAVLDMRTRPAHATADNKPENEEGLFYVGGEYLPFPGEGGSAKNVVNCRCTVTDIVDGESPQLRRGRNPLTGENETFTYKSYDKWMESNNMTQDKTGKWYERT